MLMNSSEYLQTIEAVKQEIRTAQYKATVRVNQELLLCGAISRWAARRFCSPLDARSLANAAVM